MHWQQVLGSSNVAAIGYDAEKKEVWVKFHEGSVYVYENVGPAIWDELLHSTSKGRYVQIQLKRAHKARKEAANGGTDSSGIGPNGTKEEHPNSLPERNQSKDLGYHN